MSRHFVRQPAAIVLANAHAYWDARQLSAVSAKRWRLDKSSSKPRDSDSAQGCDDAQAFDVLVKASQRENLKLREVARRIVDDTIAAGAGP